MKHLIAFWAFVLCCAGGQAYAVPIYDNGGPNGGGDEVTVFIEADDFTLGTNASIEHATGYFGSFMGDFNNNWEGVANYFFFADVGNQPGAQLASGSGQNVVATDTGQLGCCGENAFVLDFDLSSPFAATAGTKYWFGLHLASDFNNSDNIFWLHADANGTSFGHNSFQGTQNNWENSEVDYAFSLTGTALPEPSTLLLLGAGLMGLAAWRRKHAA